MMKRVPYLMMMFLFLLSKVAVADVKSEAEKTLKTSVGKVFTILADKGLTKDQKKSKVIEITNSVFGFPLMAKLSLGKEYWSQLNDEQREEFTSLFIALFQDFYADKLDIFSDEKVVFQTPIMVDEKKVQIPTFLLSKGKKYSVVYKMSNSRDGWKVYDVSVEGVSLIQTYRSQYHHILEGGQVEDLLTKMREKKLENEKL